MFQDSQKAIILLVESLKRYLDAPIKSKILPLIGFCFYLIVIPEILYRIIPTSGTFAGYLDQQTANTIIYITCIIFGNIITLIVYSIFMYFVYTKKISFLQQYRINPKRLWPWQQNQQNWKQLFRKTVKALFFNTFILGIISLGIWSYFIPRKVILNDHQKPETFTIFWQLMLFLVVQDMTSTFTHAMLHQPAFYWIHKKHHEYTTSISISAEYAHPIEFIFSNSIPTLIGFKILAHFYPVHIVSAVTWLAYRILLTSDLHSGYEFPWDFYRLLPFTSPASYHDYHHSHNVGNYASSFMWIQALMGNNKEYYKYMKQKQALKCKQA